MNVKSRLITLTVLIALALSACAGGQVTEAPDPTPTAPEVAEIESTPLPTADSGQNPTATEVQPTAEPTCEVNPPQPTPNPQVVELMSPDPAEDWIKGSEDASITIVEYADFQCPYCAGTSSVLGELVEKYPQEVRLVYRHYPLDSIHDKAVLSTQAAEAAGLQDAFWAMHDRLYQTQSTWSGLTPEEFKTWAVEQAGELGLDQAQFKADFESEAIRTEAQAAWEEGRQIGIPGTPFVMINNRQFSAQPDLATLSAVVELIMLEDAQFSQCPPQQVDPDTLYQATLKTEKGDIVVDLYPEKAPLAVNSFIFLAENDWYDQITFHRVLEDYIAQTGDPTGTGYGDPGYSFGVEVDPELTFDREGLVALANSGPESNGSQFFITLGPAPNLDGQYTIFGEVVQGMEVVEKLTLRNPDQGGDLPPGDQLIDVIIEED